MTGEGGGTDRRGRRLRGPRLREHRRIHPRSQRVSDRFGERGGTITWKGWLGDNPAYHTPVFVLAHHARAPITTEGGTDLLLRRRYPRRAAAGRGSGRGSRQSA